MQKQRLQHTTASQIFGRATTRLAASFIDQTLETQVPYAPYAFGVLAAADQARKLGRDSVACLELGVAGGNGLAALEEHALAVSQILDLEIKVFGFDTGSGLPEPRDERDMPYKFRAGQYSMDHTSLTSRLQNATLVLGDVGVTMKSLDNLLGGSQVGFVACDLDYFSSTRDALNAFCDGDDEALLLPRPLFYFDNVIGNLDASYSHSVGELAAIADFNVRNHRVSLDPVRVFDGYPTPTRWFQQIYVMHRFDHPQYRTFIGSANETSLRLE